jgi:hypothetical protein
VEGEGVAGMWAGSGWGPVAVGGATVTGGAQDGK